MPVLSWIPGSLYLFPYPFFLLTFPIFIAEVSLCQINHFLNSSYDILKLFFTNGKDFRICRSPLLIMSEYIYHPTLFFYCLISSNNKLLTILVPTISFPKNNFSLLLELISQEQWHFDLTNVNSAVLRFYSIFHSHLSNAVINPR